ncbi:beta-galactosidase [bacterium]|nr:beta-galactosidase [bacterium]
MKKFVSLVIFSFLLLSLSLGAELAKWKCVSNYIPDPGLNYDISLWRRDLRDIKNAGFDAVWIVNVWAEFQPSIDPPTWNEERIKWLREVCRMAKDEGLTVILVLGYVGEGWAPKGLDAEVWPLIPQQVDSYIGFLRQMVRETKDFPNVVYLLASEEILPATLLYNPQKRRECVEAFRKWAKEENPDINYWNERWKGHFNWDDFCPLSTSERSRWEMWMDHYLWFASILRQLLPSMVKAMREERPSAIVGFHDFLLDPVLPPPSPAKASLPTPNPFDFYSIGYYLDPKLSLLENLSSLKERINLARSLYPKLPLWVGELGADVEKVGEKKQRDWLSLAISYLKEQKIGYSIWNWRHYLERGTASFSLLKPDGSPRLAFEAVRRLNREVKTEVHIRLPNGEPLLCIYFFGHWWEPWKSDDTAIKRDLRTLRQLGFNTILLDHEFSQMLDGNWKWLDREHRLASEEGFYIVPWLEAHCGRDIATAYEWRMGWAEKLFGIQPIPLTVNQKGEISQGKVSSEEFKRYLVAYASAYIERYIKNGRILRIIWEGKERPVISLSCEMDFTAFDEQTNSLFRDWLRRRYKEDIKALNAMWGTSYKDFDEIDPRDKSVFDYSKIDQPIQPIPVEEHTRFRAELCNQAFSEMKERLKEKYPELLFLAEVPYQFGSSHPHALAYKWSCACIPEIVRFADIVLIRGTQGRLVEEEKEEIRKLKRRGQRVIYCYRVSEWINADFGKDIGEIADGLGYYSWNEMVDCHIVENPPGVGREEFRIDSKMMEKLLRGVREANDAYIKKVGYGKL